MSAQDHSKEIALLFHEYGMASTNEISLAVGCTRKEVVAVTGGHTAGIRDLRVKNRRGVEVDQWLVGRMAARLGSKRRTAA